MNYTLKNVFILILLRQCDHNLFLNIFIVTNRVRSMYLKNIITGLSTKKKLNVRTDCGEQHKTSYL